MNELAPGLWHWSSRHPDWHPRTSFGAEVGSYAVHVGDGTVLIDPLLPDPDALDSVVRGAVVVAVTIPYHVRDASLAAERWGGVVCGHPDVERRLVTGTPFIGDSDLPHGLVMHRVKRLKERPLELPEARALAFGDRVVGAEGGLRVWIQRETTDARREWFRREAVPALEPLLSLDVDRVLVTHGAPVLQDGRRALADALAAEPWYHRSS